MHGAKEVPFMLRRISSIKVGKRFRVVLSGIEELAENIKLCGLLQPIVTDRKGNLIAGQRRLEACKLLEWKSVPVHVVDIPDLLLGEYSENAFRSDFLMSERIAIGSAIERKMSLAARARQKAGVKADSKEKGQSRDKVAKILGMSSTIYERAKKVIRVAEEFPDNEMAQEALRMLDKPKGVTKASAIAKRVERVESLKPVRINPKLITLYNQDFRDVKWLENSLDLVYCDPPWTEIQLYEDVAKVAAKALKPGKYCMVYVGTAFLPKVLELMTRHLTYCWQFCINYTGAYSTMMQCGIMRRYTSVLVFTKTARNAKGQYVGVKLRGYDTYSVDNNQETEPNQHWHKWQQALSPAIYWIESTTQEGDLVADFCLGSGTFAVAANQLGRRFVGCDPDASAIRIARHRIATEKRAASCKAAS